MTTQQQKQRPDHSDTQGRQRRRISSKLLIIIIVLTLAVAISVIWILSYLNVIPGFLAPIFTIIITVLGAVFAFLQSMHLFIPIEEHKSQEYLSQTSANLQVSSTLDKTALGIIGLPPLTDARTIQQREQVVREVYSKLIQTDITAIALTGIGGVGKSTLAALIYRYVEEQRQTNNSPFMAVTLWLTIDPAVTFADLAGNLFEALDKPLPNLNNLAPQSQAMALFNVMNTTKKPRLIILDQFENLLDWNTGHALTDRPGVGEWLDILNSQQCFCRVLLTSRPRPVGTREYPPTYLREYPVGGLEPDEGVVLLRNQGVRGTDEELQVAVSHCAGHAFSLTLLASLLRDHHLDMTTLFKQTSLWTGDIATNLLDQIYQERLNDIQRKLLLAFSVYREPVLLEAAEVIITNASESQITDALKALRVQHLIEPTGGGRYQLHAIIAEYAHRHFDESNELANKEVRGVTHMRAAQYYQQQAVTSSPLPDERRNVSDVHDLVEAIWQYCQAEQWQEAYNLIEQEKIFSCLKRWGNNAILLELCLLLQPQGNWSPKQSQAATIHRYMAWAYNALGKEKLAREYNEKALQLYAESGTEGCIGFFRVVIP